MMDGPMSDKQYQAQCDLRCLIEAEKIKKDKGRLAAAMKLKKSEMAALAALDQKKGD